MKILFLQSHPMWMYGLPNGFRDLGHEVKVSGKLTEDNIPKIILSFKPDLIITLGWTQDTEKKQSEWIRKSVKLSNVPHVYWATEDPTHTYSFTLPLIQRMKPDFVFTICKNRIPFYRKLGFKSEYLDFGFHPQVNKFMDIDNDYINQIAVVGNGYPKNLKLYPNHYRIESLKILVKPLIKENVRVDFYGSGWEDLSFILEKDIPKEWIHGYLDYTLASKVYSSSDIILGIQNHTTQVTQRTYEILGSKGFLITCDTPIIRDLFKPDKDLVVSSSPEKTLELVSYYLKDKEKIENIRTQGQKSVEIHNYKNRASYMLDILREYMILS